MLFIALSLTLLQPDETVYVQSSSSDQLLIIKENIGSLIFLLFLKLLF